MSGIAGIVRLDGAPLDPGAIDTMLASMGRRGPDRQRSWQAGHAGMGQALLATTAEARIGPQPWVHPDSACVVVSDSRLDERAELLDRLGFNPLLADQIGDGELLHAAWQRWGSDCAGQLMGDFAFVLWSPRQQRLFAARDAMAVRPFYYHFMPGRLFAFGSEAGAVLAVPGISREIDQGRIADALVGELEGSDATSTFFKSVQRLAPAHWLSLQNSKLSTKAYWHPLANRPSDLPKTTGEWTEALQAQLRRAVRRRLRADVAVGSMLSGGLDSSSVVALACAEQPSVEAPLPVFSAVHRAGNGIETAAIEVMVAAFPVVAHFTDLDKLAGVLPELYADLHQLAEPFDGEMPLISAQYRAAASAGVTCLLDGMPADNLYSVGDSGAELLRQGALLRGFSVLRQSAMADQRRHPTLAALRSAVAAFLPARLLEARRASGARRGYQQLLDESLIDPAFALQVGLPDRYRRWQAEIRRHNSVQSADGAYSQMQSNYLQAAVERYGRVAAGHGIEPRHPFLDRQLVEFHALLPVELRARHGWSKWALRRAMTPLLPSSVVWRSRRDHLGLDFNRALMGYWQARDGASLAPAAWLEPLKSDRALRDCKEAGRVDAFAAVQSAWLVQAWLEFQSCRRG